MKALAISALLISWLLFAPSGSAQGPCAPDGEVTFVCGPTNPEDLIEVPRSPWVIVSSMVDEGQLYVADTRDGTATELFPSASSRTRHDAALYGACPDPPGTRFRPHGVSVLPGNGGIHTLHVVGHGDREAVEVFEVDASGDRATATWIGCVVAPAGVSLNSVASLRDGGFVVTNFQISGGGELWEWHADAGWAKVPGSESGGPNGVAVSQDERWLYIGAWVSKTLVRVSRGQTPVQRDEVEVGFQIDNIHWAPDGSLLAAGHGGTGDATPLTCLMEGRCDGVTSRVAKVDPQTLTAEEVVRYPSNDLVVVGTGAVQIGDEIWLGSIGGGNRIARFAAP